MQEDKEPIKEGDEVRVLETENARVVVVERGLTENTHEPYCILTLDLPSKRPKLVTCPDWMVRKLP